MIDDPRLDPLWDELARRYGESDQPVVTAALHRLTPPQREGLADLLGLDRLPDATTTVRIARVAAAVGVDADELRGVVERLRGPLGNRAHQRAAARVEREALWAWLSTAVTGRGLDAWVERLRRAGIPDGDVAAHRHRLELAAQVVDTLPLPEGEPLALFAARVTGDPHSLDTRTWLARTVLDAAAALVGREGGPTSAEDIRATWRAVGVVADRLSAPVLTLGLSCRADTPLSQMLNTMADAGEPVALTAAQLHRWALVPVHRHVWVVENPAVIDAAARAGLSGPLVCTASWPTEAAVQLLDALRAAGTTLAYHSDFDTTGLLLTTHLQRRFDATPWRMTGIDYEAAIIEAEPTIEIDPDDVPPTPWDPSLRAAMARHGRVVFEEQILDTLLTDLRQSIVAD